MRLTSGRQSHSPGFPVLQGVCAARQRSATAHRAPLSLIPLLLSVVVLVACGRPKVQPLIPNDVPWRAGEESEYQVMDVDGRAAGTARYVVDPAQNSGADEAGWIIRRQIDTQGDSENLEVEISQQGLRPRASQLVRTDAGGRESVEAVYNRGEVNLTLTTRQDITTYQAVNIPSDSRDERTLPMLARTLPLADGYATYINSFLPVTGNLDRVLLRVRGQEEVQVPAGAFTAWHVILESNTIQDSEAWIGADPPYPLVRFVDGRSGGTFELTSFTSGP